MGISSRNCKIHFRGALVQVEEHQSEYILPLQYNSTSEELMYWLKKTSRGISSLNCKRALPRSSCTG